MRVALFGVTLITVVLVEAWANWKPIQLGLESISASSSSAINRGPGAYAERQHAAQDQGNTEHRALPTTTDPSSSPRQRHSQEGNDFDWPAWIQAISAIATVGATIVLIRITTRQAAISRQQVVVAQRQAEIMDKQADITIATQRAFIRYETIEAIANVTRDDVLAGYAFRIHWKNAGNTPARSVRLTVLRDFLNSRNAALPGLDLNPGATTQTSVIGPQASFHTGVNLFSLEELASVAEKVGRALLIGEVRYFDLFSPEERCTQMCMELVLHGDWINAPDAYNTFNWRAIGLLNTAS